MHRSRRAGAGVLTYFAGGGAGVCSPPAKTLICAANYHCTSAKECMIDNYGILYYFVYHCGVCKTVGRVKYPIEFFTNLLELEIFYRSRSFFPGAGAGGEKPGVCTALVRNTEM